MFDPYIWHTEACVRLGKEPRTIEQIIRRNEADLKKLGGLRTFKRGNALIYYLNKAQYYYVIANGKSNKESRTELIRLLLEGGK